MGSLIVAFSGVCSLRALAGLTAEAEHRLLRHRRGLACTYSWRVTVCSITSYLRVERKDNESKIHIIDNGRGTIAAALEETARLSGRRVLSRRVGRLVILGPLE